MNVKKKENETIDKYCLETSAIIALLQNEKGSNKVMTLLSRAEKGNVLIFYSFMTRFELLYQAKTGTKKWGINELQIWLEKLKKLKASEIQYSEDILQKAVELKVESKRTKNMDCSVWDAWIAASADTSKTILFHKDRHFSFLSIRNESIL
jgi:predicted nucleic acid-binding protein